MRVWTGSPYPLGATWDGVGVNFAIFSEHATAVELCLFDSPYAGRESTKVSFTERTFLQPSTEQIDRRFDFPPAVFAREPDAIAS